ncbi:MAG TPA: hypothetical protein VF213_05895 [Dongiaceae bacterium]
MGWLGTHVSRRRITLITAAVALFSPAALAQSGAPITIGYGISQTGGLAPNGKSALLAQKIWEEETNAKGGLLGRPISSRTPRPRSW